MSMASATRRRPNHTPQHLIFRSQPFALETFRTGTPADTPSPTRVGLVLCHVLLCTGFRNSPDSPCIQHSARPRAVLTPSQPQPPGYSRRGIKTWIY
ncbi:hypothetical protein EJ04DRAFT_40023 [Polyplosphaeria fusca]|uniref:Uncharacterized protein n=1 Tax=Polyplosphaeria fusca TaxID=682080 RepID=A0A9P4V7K6_9PLEO|nr:hypothetical protein EJ04DRAFT_40023 [Polyplosphaeria fusca]